MVGGAIGAAEAPFVVARPAKLEIGRSVALKTISADIVVGVYAAGKYASLVCRFLSLNMK